MSGHLVLTACAVDLVRRQVIPHDQGARRELTTREAELLDYLARHPSTSVSRTELLARVWGYADVVVSRACDNTIRRLREKIERDAGAPDHVITVHGTGYRFEPSTTDRAATGPAAAPTAEPPLPVGAWWVDRARARLFRPGRPDVPLTEQEVTILTTLAEGPADRERLAARIGAVVGGGAVKSAIRRLRLKIEPDPASPRYLVAHAGGWALAVPPTAIGSPLVGRDALLDEVARALGAPGVVVLHGPGGVGKTAIARAIGAAFPGVVSVALEGVQHEGEWLAAVGGALGVPIGPDPERIARVLGEGDVRVLVLDGAESVHDRVAAWVPRWTTHAPGLAVLVTTRVAPAIAGARIVEVPVLGRADALRLFQERAGVGVEDPGSLVDQLDGLPLAIELAAARMRVTTPSALAARLAARGYGVLGGVERSVRASLDALSPLAREALVRASLFRRGFTVDDLEARMGDAADAAIDAVQELRDHALVHRVPRDGAVVLALYDVVRATARTEVRPDWVHDHVRALAALGGRGVLESGLLREGGAAAAAARRHLVDRWDELLEAVGLALGVGDVDAAVACASAVCWAARLHGAYDAAVHVATRVWEVRADRRMALDLGLFYFLSSRLEEAERWLTLAEGAPPTGDAAVDAPFAWRVCDMRRILAQHLRDAEATQRWADRAVEAAASGCEPARLAYARAMASPDPGVREDHLREALRTVGSNLALSNLLDRELGRLLRARGALREASSHLLAAHQALVELDSVLVRPNVEADVVFVAAERGDHAEVERWAGVAIGSARRTGVRGPEGMILAYRGASRALRGELDGAYADLERGRRILGACNLRWGAAFAEAWLAEVERRTGDPASAVHTAASALAGADGSPEIAARARAFLASALADCGELARATEEAERAVVEAEATGVPIVRVLARVRAGLVALAAGDRPAAEVHGAAARTVAATHGLGEPGSEGATLLDALGAALGAP